MDPATVELGKLVLEVSVFNLNSPRTLTLKCVYHPKMILTKIICDTDIALWMKLSSLHLTTRTLNTSIYMCRGIRSSQSSKSPSVRFLQVDFVMIINAKSLTSTRQHSILLLVIKPLKTELN